MYWGLRKTHILITFLWSYFYKSPVINVTLLEFENNSTHSTRLMLIYLIVLVEQFKHQMSKLDIKINCIHLWYVFLLVSDMYVTFYTKLLIMTLQTMIHDLKYTWYGTIFYLKMFIFIYLKLFITFNLQWREIK